MSAARRVKSIVMKTLVERQRFVMRKVQSLGVLASESAFCPMEGEAKQPVLVSPGELGITFIGHSSFLVQIAGKNLLFDPVFAVLLLQERAQKDIFIRQVLTGMDGYFPGINWLPSKDQGQGTFHTG